MNSDQIKKSVAEVGQRINGVVIGVFLSINDAGELLVAFPGNPLETAIPARSTAQLSVDDLGQEVALLFEGGDPHQPLIIGKIQHAASEKFLQDDEQTTAEFDGEHIVLSAKQAITLKCGKASVTLTKAGKIILRGTYVLSRSSGVNRIKGGSVQIN